MCAQMATSVTAVMVVVQVDSISATIYSWPSVSHMAKALHCPQGPQIPHHSPCVMTGVQGGNYRIGQKSQDPKFRKVSRVRAQNTHSFTHSLTIYRVPTMYRPGNVLCTD